MRRQLVTALLAVLVMTVLCGVVYPLSVMLVSQVLFHDAANGSLVRVDGSVVGSSLIGQSFVDPEYFNSRPSSAGALASGSRDADGEPVHFDDLTQGASGGSNLGPTNPEYLEIIEQRVAAYREFNHLDASVLVPADAVTGSGSGVDPHISVANARLQVDRIAHRRSLDRNDVLGLIDDYTDPAPFGFLGVAGVNVLELNLALDRLVESTP